MVDIRRDWIFENNTYIFRKDGTQIDPRSEEGKIISGIIDLQHIVRAQNREQRKKWINETFARDPTKIAEYYEKFGLNEPDPVLEKKKVANPK